MTITLLALFAIFTLIAIDNQRTAFFLFIGLLPAYLIRLTVLDVPTTALEIMFVILLIIWMLKREKRFIDISGWKILILLWVAVATLSMFIAPDLRAAAGLWKAYFIEPILFFIMANDFLRSKDDQKLTVRVLAGTAMIVGVLAIIQRYTAWAVPPPFNAINELRSTSFYGFPNAIGLFLAPMIPLFVIMLVTNAKKGKFWEWFWSFSIIIPVFAIVSAKSEGALVGLLAGMLLMGLMFKKTRLPTLIVGVMTAVILLIVPVTRPVVFEKITLEDWSGRVRKEMWAETSAMLKDRPILGAGLAGFPVVFAPYHKAGHIEIFQYPHNIILNFWSELGILGVIILLATIIQFYRKAFRNGCNFKDHDPWFVALSAVMTVIIIHGIVDVPYFKNDLAFQFWLIVALLSSSTALAQNNKLAGKPLPEHRDQK